MNQHPNPYQVIDLPLARRETPYFLDLIQVKHSMYGLLELDVSVVRQFIAAHKAETGEGLSFTGYLAFCMAHAVDADKSVQAYLKGRKQLVVFQDVDVGMTIERKLGGTNAPTGHVIRRANHKTFREISDEIRTVQSQPPPPSKGMPGWVRTILMLPSPAPELLVALMRAMRRFDPAGPAGMVASGGTVGVTAIGMFGDGKSSGWAFLPTPYSLMLVVGSVTRKPAVVDNRIEPREMLNLTVVFDHDVVDGAPAARFVRHLTELIENGYGLDTTDSIPTTPVNQAHAESDRPVQAEKQTPSTVARM